MDYGPADSDLVKEISISAQGRLSLIASFMLKMETHGFGPPCEVGT